MPSTAQTIPKVQGRITTVHWPLPNDQTHVTITYDAKEERIRRRFQELNKL